MSDSIKAEYTKKLIYRQKDRASAEQMNFEAVSSIWAISWFYEGLTHPVTSRARINIVHSVDSMEFDPVTAEFEIWREFEWKAVDMCFLGFNKYNTVESVENECLYMIEAFLMGKNIEEIKAKYGVESNQEDDEQNSEQEEETPNVLKLFPKK